MDRIRELLARVTELSDDELVELKDLVLSEFDATDQPEEAAEPAAEGEAPPAPDREKSDAAMAVLAELAEAAEAVQAELASRDEKKQKEKKSKEALAAFREQHGQKSTEAAVTEPAPEAGAEGSEGATTNPTEASTEGTEGEMAGNTTISNGSDAPSGKATPPAATAAGGPETVEGREPQTRRTSRTVVTAGADMPGKSMGTEIQNPMELARLFTDRISSMRGVRSGDGDKLIVASAALDGFPEHLRLENNDAEGNLAKVLDVTRPSAIVAAGGLAAPEETRYDLFNSGGVTDRPVKGALPTFRADRGGVRFIRPPSLNDLNGAVGIWTVEDDIEAATNVNVRKPAFRVNHGPEIVVDTQAITMILTFGNLVSRAYPELVARHNELALVAQARVAEQQLLTQIGALSTHVSGRNQKLSAIREILMQVDMASASYRNRHRTGDVPLQCIMPDWFKGLLRADIAAQHPGDGLEIFDIAESVIEGWFRSRNINITWALDGEEDQDYGALASGSIMPYPEKVVWYLYLEGTFAFMDGGTLDLGLVRDSTLNSANDYQMFVETFENVVKFGHESLRIESKLLPTGRGSADVEI